MELLAPSYVRAFNEGATFAKCTEWYKHPEALTSWKAFWGPVDPAVRINTGG